MSGIRVSLSKGHPAPFPDLLPERLIKLYTIEGDTVLDPFGGSRTTMKVDYYSIIYEINPAYIKIKIKVYGVMQRLIPR